MKISVVIPAYNEEHNIAFIVKSVEFNLERLSDDVTSHEIIICDDHSSDGTFDAVVGLKKENIKCIRLSRRSGSHTAIRAGLLKASGDAVLCISADGQDDPEVLPQMIGKLKEGKQIIWGVRKSRNEPWMSKQLGNWFYKMLSWFVANENNIDLAHADFYLLDRKVVNALNACKERNTSLFGLIAWIGFKQAQVRYERKDRNSGKSKWNFKSKLKLAIDWILAFSGLPLKLISLFGIVFASMGFLYTIYIIIISVLGYTSPGWAETAILILLLGGIQMIMIGVIGEYLYRNLDESRNRPLFFEEQSSEDYL